jgi:hypothetical protein
LTLELPPAAWARRSSLAIIDFLADHTTTPSYCGWPFMNSAIEFPDADSPQNKSAMAMKQEARCRLRQLCTPLTTEPGQLADKLILLIEGGLRRHAPLGGKDGPDRFLPRAAHALLASVRGCRGAIGENAPGEDR